MDYADNHLSRVVQQQIPLLKLAVNVAVIGSEFCSVDQLMELVRKAKVEELSIFVQTRDFNCYYGCYDNNNWYNDDSFEKVTTFYEFPYSITEAKWLRSLTVQGCKFTGKNFISNNNAGMYSSLQQLYLSRILLFDEEALSNIASCCPEIEIIEFNCCSFWIESLMLLEFLKLKKASVVGKQDFLDSLIYLCVLSIHKNEFVLDELEAIKTSQPKSVHVQVEISYVNSTWKRSTAFADGLVWSTCPATLSVTGYCYDFVKLKSINRRYFDLQYLCEKLAKKSRDKSCCDQQLCNKCWWHNINDFEVKHKIEDMTQNLTSLMEMIKPSRTSLSGWISPIDLDRFSELPEHIIHHILSFLPIKDIVRARILSKTWKSLSNSYEILLDLDYDHNSFALELLLDTEIVPEIDEIRDRFMDYADNHLSRVVQQQIPVLKLAVNVAVIGSEFCGVNQLMELVRKAKVEELSIFVQTRDFHWYDDDDVVFEQGMYSSLQQLCLSQVLLFSDEVLSNIANCCPEIEVIEFDCCFFWISILQLSKFPKLKKAIVEGRQGNLQSVDITETNLESFCCNSLDLDCLMNLAACSNIRVLELSQCYISEPDLLKDLTTSFPLLEKAELFDVMHYTEVFDRITAANSHLKSLKLLFNRVIQKISINCPKLSHFDYIGAGFEEVYLDCPRLRTCYYNSSKVPRKILLDLPTDIQYNVFSFSVYYKLGKSWFINIRKFLEHIAGCDTVYLRLDWHSLSPDMADEFVLDEFEGVQTFKPKNVHLQLKIYFVEDISQFLAAFVDGLVWSTRPTTLRVGCDCYEFVKYLCEKLAEKSRDKSCCDQQLCNKYWWHNISDFEVKYKKEDMTHNLTSLVEMTKQSRKGLSGRLRPVDLMPFCFKFEWNSTERFTAKFLVEMARSNLNT
ncbi:hypothetical protein RDABS01_029039 [Bienertia sinuspersici]